jgi:CTP synthase
MNTKQEKTKVIFIFGGVYSSLGKGIVVSSIAKILTNLNKKVSVLKFDPYLNVDPGAMAPGQHGEVYVTKDGAQTDLDLGHYERFIGRELTQLSSVTSGRIYNEIIRREREGKYNGKTVQVIPHVTNEIKERIYQIIQSENPDFLIIEVGGTVGDSESIPFTEAISQFVLEHGQENTIVCLVSPLISLSSTSGELKTKPTQHSIRQLRSLGVSPNFLILRSSVEVGQDTFEKIQLSSHIYKDNIFISPDLDSIYELPEKLYEQNIHLRIFNYFKIKYDKEKDTFKKN